MTASMPHTALFAGRQRTLVLRNPRRVVVAHVLDEVVPALAHVEAAVADGLYAAGYLAYEAAPAFDAALATHPATGQFPLLWYGLYEKMQIEPTTEISTRSFAVGPWEPLVDAGNYAQAIHRIRELIAAGDTYQVNYTFPMRTTFHGDALDWFWSLWRAQRTDFAAFIDAGRYQILSASPELFFRLDGRRLVTRPMKGTRPRGRWPDEDRRMAEELAQSGKDRAENLMIVDLLRNDMGRISQTGSVRVARLFDVERYETVWQMTSTIESETAATVPEVFKALFPSGSVTGAPKIRTMEIIRDLEPSPRGVYCGAVGWWAPDGRAEFNVAIRTVTLDTTSKEAVYSVGGGITWDSTPQGEYEECRTKAAVLSAPRPDFELLESILFDGGFFLLSGHMARLAASADYFGFALDVQAIEAALRTHTAAVGAQPLKVRLLVARDGTFRIESAPAPLPTPIRLGFAAEPVMESDVFLYHKTTHRCVYERAKASRPDCDDVLLWNRQGEITETTSANVVLKMEGRWLTPPLRCGLLPGTMRAHLLAGGEVREAVLTKNDVVRAAAIRLINSVRKWVDVEFVG